MVVTLIISDDGFFSEFEESRLVSIAGHLGAGKTLLAMVLAEHFLRRGYRLVTNSRSVWSDPWDDIKPDETGGYKSVVLLDEGGIYIRTMKSVSALAQFARKIDTYIIIACKREPHEELTGLVIEPRYNAWRNWRIPIWIWRWTNRAAKVWYSGTIIEIGRSGYYGTYSTVDPGEHPFDLLGLTKNWAKALFERYGRHYDLSDVETGGGYSISDEAMVAQANSARAIQTAISTFGSKKRRRTRRSN